MCAFFSPSSALSQPNKRASKQSERGRRARVVIHQFGDAEDHFSKALRNLHVKSAVSQQPPFTLPSSLRSYPPCPGRNRFCCFSHFVVFPQVGCTLLPTSSLFSTLTQRRYKLSCDFVPCGPGTLGGPTSFTCVCASSITQNI